MSGWTVEPEKSTPAPAPVVSTMDEWDWSPDQVAALERIEFWANGGAYAPREFRIGGLAGSGKTTVVGHIAASLASKGVRVEFCAPTGRAASILAAKSGLPARTVHSVLKYGPAGSEHDEDCDGGTGCVCAASKTFVKREMTDFTRGEQTVIVVDEASMLTRWMYDELMGLGAKVLFCGDYGQLPPVGDSGFSIVAEDRLDVNLRSLHRQAEGNPIIALAWDVRQGGAWEPQVSEDGRVRVISKALGSARIGWQEDRMILCYTNRTRVARNREIRGRRGGEFLGAAPVAGDIVICLRNDPERGVYNGQRGTVVKTDDYGKDPNLGLLVAKMENGMDYVGPVVKAQFGSQTLLANEHGGLFDFGYCITTHKAQGSEAGDVLVLAEDLYRMPEADKRKWRYTAVTRAKESLTVLVPPGR